MGSLDVSTPPAWTASATSRMLAPSTAGRDMRKEKRTAKVRSKPRSIPAEMVIPAREIPGRVPTAWAQPTSRASTMVALRAFFRPLAIRSEKKSRKPVAMRAADTKVTLEKAASTTSFTSSTAKRGRVATMIMSTSRRASGGRP